MDCIDFLCINCQELISEEKVPAHSLICVHPLRCVIEIDLEPIITQLVYKLNKLKSALIGHITDKTSQIDRELYEFLIVQTNEIMSIEHPTEDTVDRCKTTISVLQRYSEAFLNPSVLLYNERLRVLASEAVKVLEDQQNAPQVNVKDLNYREIMQAKEAAIKGMIRNNQNIDEISSQISQIWNNRPSTSSFTSPDDENVPDTEDLDVMYQLKEKEHVKQTSEDLQRYFFSKCLVWKLTFPVRDPAQYIQIPCLYKNVLELELPVEQWEDYIKDQFTHPERWLNTSLIHK